MQQPPFKRVGQRGGDKEETVEDLLAQQVIAVQQLLAGYSERISRVLAKQAQPSQVQQTPFWSDGALSARSDLSRPLLACCYATPAEGEIAPVEIHSAADPPMQNAPECPAPSATDARAASRKAIRPREFSNQHPSNAKQKEDDRMGLFPKKSNMRSQVTDSLSKPRFNVEALYKDEGCWQYIAKHPNFNNLSLAVIVINTFWVAINTDYNKAEVLCNAPMIFQVMDNFFCTFFTSEMVVRFGAFRRKKDVFKDAWFIFDGFLVLLMIWETWIMVLLYKELDVDPGAGGRSSSVLRIFRVFRLTRVARTARILTSVPELMILAKGMFIAMRSVFAVLALLILVVYVFGIVFVELLYGTDVGAGTFDTVPEGMNFLLLQVLCGFDADFVMKLLKANLIYYLIFLVYILLASLTIMNMLIGILCDVVSTVADVENEEYSKRDMAAKITTLAKRLDQDGSESITQTEFVALVQCQELTQALDAMGVDVLSLVDFATFLFQECTEISYSDFMQVVFQFRKDKVATVKDVLDMRKQMTMGHLTLESLLQKQTPGGGSTQSSLHMEVGTASEDAGAAQPPGGGSAHAGRHRARR